MSNVPLLLSGIQADSIVDGPGIRTTFFCQGCPHDCPGCHNPETHDFAGGSEVSVERLLQEFPDPQKGQLFRIFSVTGKADPQIFRTGSRTSQDPQFRRGHGIKGVHKHGFTGEEPEQVVSIRLDKEYYEKLSAENDVYSDRPSRAQVRYIDSVVAGVANREEDLNAQIQKFSIGWDVSRISRLARSIMQLAIFETLYVDDVPTGVAISEAVRIAKLYDGDDTGSFVNGILGAFARSLNTEVEA